MAFSNTIYSDYLINNSLLVPSEAIWTPIINTPNTMRVVLQLQSIPRQEDNPPTNPTQVFEVYIYNIAYNDTQDTTPMLSKRVSITGNNAIGSVFFDTIGMAKVRFQIVNRNQYGVFLTVRLTEAKLL